MRAPACVSLLAGLLMGGLSLADALEVPEARYPPLPKLAPSSDGFVPRGWVIESQAEGDLNGDGLPDLLLVLRQDDPAFVVSNEPDRPGMPELDTNPRILAVAFARIKGGYELAVENHDFIPRYDTPTIDDPFAGAGIVDGAISIGLHFWANAGSWYTGDTTYFFKYRDHSFCLVGYHDYTTKRNTGEIWDVSIDYLVGEAQITIGNFSDEEAQDATYKKSLAEAPLSTLEEIGSGWDFQPEQRDPAWWGLENTDE